MSEANPQIDTQVNLEIEQVISAINTAWRSGRRIIPLVGAGLSADSGIPVIRSLYRYFAKFQQLLSHRAYLPLPNGWNRQQDPLSEYVELFKKHPATYVQALGWPDRYDLNQDLLTALEKSQPGWKWTRHGIPLVHLAVQHGYREILTILKPETTRSFLSLVKRLLPKDPPPSPETVEEHLWSKEGKYEPFQLFEDWRKLIQHFTHYQGEYADVLFHRLCVGRRPNQGHRFLAFLVKLLSIRSVFTFNFDELIEQSLRAEEIDHQVFSMEHGGSLPHPGLVQDITAVVKMHGSTHALLLDERLDHPLDERYKRRFREIAGSGPLLLVVGCGGDDYRLRDLLDYTVRGDEKAQVAWIHFEPSLPSQIDNLAKGWEALRGHRESLIAAPTNNIGLTLQHIHTGLTGRHPASPVRYTAHINRPYRLGSIPQDGTALADECGKSSFTVLTSLTGSGTVGGTIDAQSKEHLPRTASEMLVDVAAVWNRWGWQTVWVDLEAVHTLAAVAGAIVDQCRSNDVSLAPSVLPVRDVAANGTKLSPEEQDCVVRTAVRRVTDALRRSRYLVVLDGLEAYLWPPTTHHGETTNGEHQAEARLDLLQAFFLGLANQTTIGDSKQPAIGESKIVLGVDHPRPRVGTSDATKYHKFVAGLTEAKWQSVQLENKSFIRFEETFNNPQTGSGGSCEPFIRAKRDNVKVWDDLINLIASNSKLDNDSSSPDPARGWGIALLLLASARRGRHLVTARRLLRPLFARGQECDKALRLMTSGATGYALGMSRLEGGGLWMHRPVRDYIYAQNSCHIGTAQMTELLSGKSTPEDCRMAASQAFTLAVAHQHLSRLYYAHTFVQSEDAVAFLEYVYHRVSSTRYFSKTLALLNQNGDSSADGIRDAVKAFRSGLAKKGWERFRRGFEVERGFGPVFEQDQPLAKIVASVQSQHARQIKALARSWVRAERFLRTQLPAEQLLHWCDTLLTDDIPKRMNRVLIRPKDDTDAASYPKGRDGLNPTAKRYLDEFKEAVADFAVKLQFERGDFAGAEQARQSSLFSGGEKTYQAVLNGLPAKDQLPDAATVTRVHYLLDIAACQVKQGEYTDKQSAVDLEALKQRIDCWVAMDVATSMDADLSEARLRCEYLSAEAAFPHTSVFAQQWGDFQTVEGQNSLKAGLEKADLHIENGLDALRGQSPRGDARLRSLILEPTSGGSLYLPYRAAFYSLLGRVQWLKALADTTDDAATEAAFESAYQSFDLALGGLRHSNHQIAAQVELFRVEACLARARLALGQQVASNGTANGQTDPIGLARSKYEAARTGLQRVRGHLLTGRRNVIWWKLYYALCAQYHADRLSLALVMLVDDVPSARPISPPKPAIRPGDILRRLRRGYEAVRCWIDLQELADAPQRQWLYRITRTLTCAAYGLGWLFLRHYHTPLRAEQTVTPEKDNGSLHAKPCNQGTMNSEAGDDDKLQCQYIRHALVWVGRTSRLIELNQQPQIELLLRCNSSTNTIKAGEVLANVRKKLDDATKQLKGSRQQNVREIYSELVENAYFDNQMLVST